MAPSISWWTACSAPNSKAHPLPPGSKAATSTEADPRQGKISIVPRATEKKFPAMPSPVTDLDSGSLPDNQIAPSSLPSPDGDSGTSSPPYLNRIFGEDCVAGMKARLPDASCDLIITDPPFAIDFGARRTNYNRTASRVLGGYNEITSSDYADFSRRWIAQATRVLKPTGSFFIFSGWNNLKDILIAAEENGLHQVNHIIWKYQFGVATRRRFVTSHYHCLFYCLDDKKRFFNLDCRFSKRQRTSTGGSARYRDMEDVWIINREYWTGDIKTPTKLPRELVTKILMYTSRPDDVVLDPFLGSGQVAVISKLMGRRFIGFEIVRAYLEFARERLQNDKYRISCTTSSRKEKVVRKGLFGNV